MYKLIMCICMMAIAFALSGCTADSNSNVIEQSDMDQLNAQITDLNQEVDILKDENQRLLDQLDALRKDKQVLLEDNQVLQEEKLETDEILNCLKNMYDGPGLVPYTQRFLEENKGIRALPDSRLEPLRNIGKGTVLEVLAVVNFPGDSGFNTWLFVHTDAGDTPCPNFGWIRKDDTVAYTGENQKLATYPLYIMPGTKDLQKNILISDTDINERYWLDFYDGDNAQLYGSGGRIFIIPRDRIIYPAINSEDITTDG